MWYGKVLGQPPQEGEDTLIPLRDIEKCLEVEPEIEDKENPFKRVIGVDVARFGTDKTVITLQKGLEVVDVVWYSGRDLNWTIAKIKELDAEFKSNIIAVDDTGVGGGVTDGLKGYKRTIDDYSPSILPVNFGSIPPGKTYPNISL